MSESNSVLDRNKLEQLGIGFDTDEESEVFENIIREEHEVRVGMEISKTMSEAMLNEFDKLTDPTDATAFLEKNCPDFRNIVKSVTVHFKRELLRYRDQIEGISRSPVLETNRLSVKRLDMSMNARIHLREAGILTYGELSAIEDLFTVDELTPKNIREIKEVLELAEKEGIQSILI